MENTSEQSQLIEEIKDFMKDKVNSYNRSDEEKAYWTCRDALELAVNSDNPKTLSIARSLFERYKWYL